MTKDPQYDLITTQLKHTIDLLKFEIESLRSDLKHHQELNIHRLTELESCSKDFEQRIRTLTDDVTTNKTRSNLVSGGAGFMSLVALLRSFFVV